MPFSKERFHKHTWLSILLARRKAEEKTGSWKQATLPLGAIKMTITIAASERRARLRENLSQLAGGLQNW